MTVRTLLILGSSLTGLAVARVAARSGLACHLVDSDAGPAAPTRTARFRRLPSMEFDALIATVADLRGRDDVAVIADSDRWLRFVRAHGERLRAEHWLVLHPDAAALDACLDKTAFLKWCALNALPAPRLYAASALGDLSRAPYPLMVRPEWTQHSSNTGLPKAIEVRDAVQLAYWLERYAQAKVTPSICDSLLRPGLRQFSVGAARNAAGSVRTFLAEKVRPDAEQCAGGTFVTPAAHPGIEELAAAALQALGFFGVAEIEILFDPAANRGYLIEINARPWLQLGLPHACGCDLMAHAMARPDRAGVTRNSAHAWLYFSSDLYAVFSRTTGLVPMGKLGLVGYLQSLWRADLYATWDWADPRPALASVARTAWRLFRGG